MENMMSKYIHKYTCGLKPLLILLFINLLGFYPSLAGNHNAANSLKEFKEHQKPFYFLENKGQIIDQYNQTNKSVIYQLALPGMNVSLKSNGFSYDTWLAEDLGEDSTLMTSYYDMHSPVPHKYNYKFHRVDINFLDVNASCKIEASGKAPDYNMYYTTGTPEEGAKVYQYERVLYENLYDGIDLEFVAKPGTNKPVEYNFIIHPGADVSQIKMRYTGALKNDLVNGNLELKLAHTTLTESIPSSWIKETGKVVKVAYSEISSDNMSIVLGFTVDRKEANSTLIIDPVPNLDWGTYFGGGDGDGFGISTDLAGNIYIVGRINGNNVATSGAYQSTNGGNSDGFITKFNSGGSRIWGTYYGGPDIDELHDIDINSLGEILVGGSTYNSIGLATAGAYQTSISGNNEAIIAKFDSIGNRIWGTYYGGLEGDLIECVSFDVNNNIIAAGSTRSLTGISTLGSHQVSYSGGPNLNNNDCFVVKFSPSGIRQWGTYFGGTNRDDVYSIATDFSGNIYIGGITRSDSVIATQGSHLSNLAGFDDGFIVKFDSAGGRLWGTYYGGSSDERIRDMTVDYSGDIIVSGFTRSLNGIATSSAFQPNLSTSGSYDGFIAKFSALGNRIWGTYFGGISTELVWGVDTDINNNIYIAGESFSTGLATPSSYQTTLNGTADAFLAKFDFSGNRVWCTYYGGIGTETLYALAIDKYSNIYLTGNTWSTNGIATSGSFQSNLVGLTSPFIAHFSECNFLNIIVHPASQSVNLNTNVQFTVSSLDTAAIYQWQTDIGFGFQNLTNAGQYSGVNNDTLNVSNITLGNNNQLLRCIVFNGSCSDTSNTAVLTVITTGINEVSGNSSFWVHPNPVTDILQLNTTASNLNVVYSIIDLTGRVISTGNISSESTQIDMGQLVSGIYLLRIDNGNDFFKIVKN